MAFEQKIDVEDVLKQLTTDEKIRLISGIDNWHLSPIDRFGIPSIRCSDGPNGVRGTKAFNGTAAACLPNGTALASTWDVDLIREGGAMQGEEAIAKGASVILGPTINMQRSPLGGRGFESFSEDPYLSGRMGAATVKGIQSKGVAATVKHFVCNDQEDERWKMDAVVTERAFREIYLLPFQLTQALAQPWCYMTAYNRLNGTHCSENSYLLRGILREEWGADTMIMSDWYGTYSSESSIKVGLDLEMPGPAYQRGSNVSNNLLCGKLTEDDIDACAKEVLKLINRVLPLGIPSNAVEKTIDTKETSEMLHRIASSTIVLLKNDKNVLPLKKDKTVAVIGPNAKAKIWSGGGSATLAPYYVVTPYEGIAAQAESVKYAEGAAGYKMLPLLGAVSKTADGRFGVMMRCYDLPSHSSERKFLEEVYVLSTDMLMFDFVPEGIKSLPALWYGDITATITPERSCSYAFSIMVAGTAKLFVDGHLVVDNETKQTRGEGFFGQGTVEVIGSVKLEAGKTYKILIEYGSLVTSPLVPPGASSVQSGGIRLGCAPEVDEDAELEAALKLAREVDQVVICTGLSADWESEGYDRKTMDLPRRNNELISKVLEANPNSVVVIQSGMPVTMPWASSASAIVQAWYGGNETGNAIADILFGKVNPNGKLPLSFPHRNEDNPAFLNYRSERGRTLYGEDVYVGYRYYEKTQRPVLFPFGHGLSYTTFSFNDLKVSEKGEYIIASVEVKNTGDRAGAEVIQVYVSQRDPSINRPVKELKGFAKVQLEKSQSKRVDVSMAKKYATSFWDEQKNSWISEKDTYDVLVGNSSADKHFLKGSFEVPETTWWKGL